MADPNGNFTTIAEAPAQPAAEAATFNNPMLQLSAKLGNLATLLTTAKTSLVAALNEALTMPRGTVRVGNASGAASNLDAKGAGKILVGDGTDVKSVAVSGDMELTAGGALTVKSKVLDGGNVAAALASTPEVVYPALPILVRVDFTGAGEKLIGFGGDVVLLDLWAEKTVAPGNASGDITFTANGDEVTALGLDLPVGGLARSMSANINEAYIQYQDALTITVSGTSCACRVYILAVPLS